MFLSHNDSGERASFAQLPDNLPLFEPSLAPPRPSRHGALRKGSAWITTWGPVGPWFHNGTKIRPLESIGCCRARRIRRGSTNRHRQSLPAFLPSGSGCAIPTGFRKGCARSRELIIRYIRVHRLIVVNPNEHLRRCETAMHGGCQNDLCLAKWVCARCAIAAIA